MLLTVTLLIELLVENIKVYSIEKFLDMCISLFTSKGNNIEKQFIYCINSALIKFSQKYGFEYNIDNEITFLETYLNKVNFFLMRIF